MPSVLVPLAEGFEEIEAVTIIDILRRAGADVVVAGLDRDRVEGSHGIVIETDVRLSSVDPDRFDMIVLPGGMPGAENLTNSKEVLRMVRKIGAANRYMAAVCAAPMVLEEAGVLAGRTVTSHPKHARFISSARHTGGRVEVDEKVITGQAAGSAMEFTFKLVEILFGKEKSEEVNRTVLARL